MGWWSEDIMGGDSPLDLQSFIYDALDINQYPNDDYEKVVKIPKDAFNYEKIIKYLKDKDADNYYLTGDDGNIFHQVLGVMMMEVGAPISDELKANMIIAAEQDEWANEDGGNEDRKVRMNNFIATLKSYNGTPTVIISAGLFETIAKGIASEEPKLFSAQQVIYCVSEVAAELGYTPTSDKMKKFNDATVKWIEENS